MRKRHAGGRGFRLKPPTRASPHGSRLLAVKLDDELLVDRAVYVVAYGQRHHARAHLRAVRRDYPVRAAAAAGGLPGALDVRVRAARLLDADRVARLDLERGDVDLAPVDLDVAVVDELSRLASRRGEASAVDRVVQAALQDRKSTRLNSSHAKICPRSLHDALPISAVCQAPSTCAFARLASLTPTVSPALTWNEGMSTLRPLTSMWPWLTSCRAWRRDVAKPAR